MNNRHDLMVPRDFFLMAYSPRVLLVVEAPEKRQ